MGTVTQVFGPRDAMFLSSGFAQFQSIGGTNFPVDVLAFDGGSSNESALFTFCAVRYGSGNLSIRVRWRAASGTSGNVVWGARLAAITPNTDSQSIATKAFGSAATVQDSHLGSVAARLHECTIDLSSLDSLAADDWCVLELYRNASDTTNDTLTDDALVVEVAILYSDT